MQYRTSVGTSPFCLSKKGDRGKYEKDRWRRKKEKRERNGGKKKVEESKDKHKTQPSLHQGWLAVSPVIRICPCPSTPSCTWTSPAIASHSGHPPAAVPPPASVASPPASSDASPPPGDMQDKGKSAGMKSKVLCWHFIFINERIQSFLKMWKPNMRKLDDMKMENIRWFSMYKSKCDDGMKNATKT